MAKPALIASVLDPRHKHLRFFPQAQKEVAKAKFTEICAALEMATTGGDEKLVSCAQAGDAQPSQNNAMMLLLGEDYSTPQQATDYPEAEVEI